MSNALRAIQSSLDSYLKALRIETDGLPRPFASVADDWQVDEVRAIAPAIESLVLDSPPEPKQKRAWWVRPRGHSKTADVAMLLARVLAFSKRRRRAIWIAADREQGCEGLLSIQTLCRHNPWLDQLLTIRTDRIENLRTGSTVNFATSDVLSAFGWKDTDLFILDEVTHWGLKGEELWSAVYSAAGKRSSAVLLALMNAGFGDTWQERLRDTAEADPNWLFSELPGPVASWITQVQLDDQLKYLPRIAYDRLWLNRWSEGSGDALDPDEIKRSIRLNGPIRKSKREYVFFGGLDLGLSRDKAALAMVGKHVGSESESIIKPRLSDRQQTLIDLGLLDEPDSKYRHVRRKGTGRIRLADLRVWSPPRKGKVDIEQIEEEIVRLHEIFHLRIGADPWQAAYLIQRLQKRGVEIEAVDFTGNNLKSMCSATLEAFSEGLIELYDNKQLMTDLGALRVVEKSYGVRLDSPRGLNGHGDAATALAISLHVAKEPRAIFSNTPDSLIIG